MKKIKKSQSSLEYLILFGIVFSILIMLSSIFFYYFNSSKNSSDIIQLNSIGENIITKIEEVYFLEKGSKISYKFRLVRDIKNISIHHFNENLTYLNFTLYDNQNLIFSSDKIYINFSCIIICDDINNGKYFNQTRIFTSGKKILSLKNNGSIVLLDFK